MNNKKFKLQKDYTVQTNILNKEFHSDFLEVLPNGKMTVKEGFEWDGCTPKIRIFGILIGTPDGSFDFKTQLPITYYASLIHDAIYKYKHEIVITRKEADLLFLKLLQINNFKFSMTYYRAVRLFGWACGKWLVK